MSSGTKPNIWGFSSAGSPVGIKTHPQSDGPATINSQQKTPSKRFASWILWGISSAGRALAWHARGHRFDPGNLHQKEKHYTETCGAFFVKANRVRVLLNRESAVHGLQEGHRDYNSPVISTRKKSIAQKCVVLFSLTPNERGLSSPGKAPYMDRKRVTVITTAR